MCRYAVVDLEMCRVHRSVRNKKYRWANETIQIGAVLLNEAMEVQDKFVTYVFPQFGSIDTYISNLTGIGRSDVSKAPVMEEALNAFIGWLPDDVRVVSWSDNDKLQILHEIEAKNICIDKLGGVLNDWLDCQKIFGEKMHSSKCYKLSEALIAADILYEEGAHDGLVDAYNTALLFAKMEREEELTLNPYYQSAISERASDGGFTIGSLFAGLELQNLVVA